MSLAKIRKSKGFTQDTLTEKVGMSAGYIGRLECGNRKINKLSGDTLLKIAQALDCSIEEILEEDTTTKE